MPSEDSSWWMRLAVQACRRAADTAGFHHGQKGFQFAKVHVRFFRYSGSKLFVLLDRLASLACRLP
jgi:hypothetical protein